MYRTQVSLIALAVTFLSSFSQENLILNSKPQFTRNDGPAYIGNLNAGGYLTFVTNGRTTNNANANLILNPDMSSEFNGNVLMNKPFLSFSRSDGPSYIRAVNSGRYLTFVTNGKPTNNANANLILNPDMSSEFNGNVLMNGHLLSFSRSDGPSYIRAANSGGYLTFVTNGKPTNNASANLILKNDKSSVFHGDVAVYGKIEAKEIKVNLAPVPTADFVFDSNYDLKELGEVEQFIKNNRHLPDIPSAGEMEKNGVDLATMNAKLLQKIEELTLYMIEQNKQSNGMELRLDRLEEENRVLLESLKNAE